MANARPRLTAEIEKAIVAYARAGGYPEVAAEAAGVPREVFADWLARGDNPRGGARYRAFARAVRQAVAQARLGAEVSARQDKPLDWLRSGPGRETPTRVGWTGTVRPRGADAAPPLLADPQVQALLRSLLQALAAFPEARAALADHLGGLPPSTDKGDRS